MNVVNFGNARISGNSLVEAISTTLTPSGSNGTLSLTSASSGIIQIVGTGTSALAIILPNATTLISGQHFELINDGIQNYQVSIKSNDGTFLNLLYPGARVIFTCVDTSTIAGTWVLSSMSRLGPERTFNSWGPFNALYNAESTLTATLLYNGPIASTGTFNLYLPDALTFLSNLATRIGFTAPKGFNFQTCLSSISGTQTIIPNNALGAYWYGPTTITVDQPALLWFKVQYSTEMDPEYRTYCVMRI